MSPATPEKPEIVGWKAWCYSCLSSEHYCSNLSWPCPLFSIVSNVSTRRIRTKQPEGKPLDTRHLSYSFHIPGRKAVQGHTQEWSYDLSPAAATHSSPTCTSLYIASCACGHELPFSQPTISWQNYAAVKRRFQGSCSSVHLVRVQGPRTLPWRPVWRCHS